MTAAILYPILAAAFFYLGSRATVTSWLWSRYPRPLAKFMDCAACSGFWYSVGLAVFGAYYYDLDVLGLSGKDPVTWIVVGLCGMWTTPKLSVILQDSLESLGTAIEDPIDTMKACPLPLTPPSEER